MEGRGYQGFDIGFEGAVWVQYDVGFVFERFFIYAHIDGCENFPYVDAFETAIYNYYNFYYKILVR